MPDVAVASSAYNLAGEREYRPDLLKSMLMGHISSDTPLSIGETIVRGYRGSSVFRMRRFLSWSKTDPDFLSTIGATSGMLPAGNLDLEEIELHVPPWDEEEVVHLVWPETFVGLADPEMWVIQYMARYHYGIVYTWTFDPVDETATIRREGEDDIVLHMPGYIPGQKYLYVHYLADNSGTFRSFWWYYRYGTGNAVLDAIIDGVDEAAFGVFYPPIPFRYLNQPVTADSPDPNLVEIYPLCKKAFRKAYGSNFDDVQDKIMDPDENPSLGDIDYIYAAMGVTLNTTKNSELKYIYEFLEFLTLNTYNHSLEGKTNLLLQWETGTWGPESSPPWKSIKVQSLVAGVSNYRTDIKWAFMNMSTGTGLLKPDARIDELWFEVLPNPLTTEPPDIYVYKGWNQEVAINWQVTADSWKRIVVMGLQYNNYVYQTDHTVVTAKEALQKLDGDSEFIIPLHEDIFDSLPLVDMLQVGTSSSWLIFNCFEMAKDEWYQSGWFKVLLVVVILAVSITAAILTGGTSLGAGGAAVAGILTGSGLSTVAALIIAAAVDVLAGILISYLIGLVATELFGPKWGPLIGAIVSFVFSFGMNVGSITEAISALSDPGTWVALATATGNGVAGYLQGQAQQVAEETAKMLEEYSEKNAEVQRKYDELTGGSASGIDLGVMSQYRSDLTERPADFLTRTLMTGGDIVEITLRQIEDFTRNNLRLELA